MDKTLDEVKELLSTKYLGRAGVHSIGISRSENAVRVYVQPGAETELEDVLKEIEREAAPYKIVPIKSDPASIS